MVHPINDFNIGFCKDTEGNRPKKHNVRKLNALLHGKNAKQGPGHFRSMNFQSLKFQSLKFHMTGMKVTPAGSRARAPPCTLGRAGRAVFKMFNLFNMFNLFKPPLQTLRSASSQKLPGYTNVGRTFNMILLIRSLPTWTPAFRSSYR